MYKGTNWNSTLQLKAVTVMSMFPKIIILSVSWKSKLDLHKHKVCTPLCLYEEAVQLDGWGAFVQLDYNNKLSVIFSKLFEKLLLI
jgi:hypothetical protein